MKKTILTKETSLRIWTTGNIVVYGENTWGTLFASSVGPEEFDVTPGSLTVTDTENDGKYKKKITFRTPLDNTSKEIMLSALAENHLVAMYKDERGVDRLFGSPKWPATLTWVNKGGSAEVTITATGDKPNRKAIPYTGRGTDLLP
ncbi:MAG: hypothetical protein NC311_13145 [Muribaculaceae bacterium]|nr:hypothetical protein [Muribaculaceae bacterium]